jgi:hypothetical protein
MRMSAAKLVGVFAIGGVLLGSTACGPVDSITGGAKKTTACKNIETELKNVASSGGSVTGTGGTDATAQKFADAAAKIRSEGQNAGGDVETAATAFAGDLDETASTLRKLSSGNLSGGTPDFTKMQQHGEDLGKACGYNGFHIGG